MGFLSDVALDELQQIPFRSVFHNDTKHMSLLHFEILLVFLLDQDLFQIEKVTIR
jgi:hypothetical protein